MNVTEIITAGWAIVLVFMLVTSCILYVYFTINVRKAERILEKIDVLGKHYDELLKDIQHNSSKEEPEEEDDTETSDYW